MIYLTYNDQPSGIYNSQVIDVVKYLNSIQSNEKVKLVALISIRSFFKNRKLIKERLPQSTVLPMVPKAEFWRWNYFGLFFLFLFTKKQNIMARGPFATCLAIWLKKSGLAKKIIFDGRGAYKAELNEYDVVKSETIKQQIEEIEKHVVLNSDFRLAVSNALINYWKKEFGYASDKHIVVPCTLSNELIFDLPAKEKLNELKKEIGFNENDIVIVYSGSSAGWQSLELVESLLTTSMTANNNIKLLWLTHQLNENSEFVKKFRSRIISAWVKHELVKNYLLAADHGLMYRENSVTNQVASPVKFAEYLICGLNVIISESLGDFSEFIKQNNCGSVGSIDSVSSVNYETKLRNHTLAIEFFQKASYRNEYLKLLQI